MRRTLLVLCVLLPIEAFADSALKGLKVDLKSKPSEQSIRKFQDLLLKETEKLPLPAAQNGNTTVPGASARQGPSGDRPAKTPDLQKALENLDSTK